MFFLRSAKDMRCPRFFFAVDIISPGFIDYTFSLDPELKDRFKFIKYYQGLNSLKNSVV